MSDFKKTCITFSILKLQKCDTYQHGVEFRNKPIGNDVSWPPPFFPFATFDDMSTDEMKVVFTEAVLTGLVRQTM